MLEFQYSSIKSEERRARNAFYEKLVWIVNGSTRIRYKAQFLKLLNESNFLNSNLQMKKVYLDDSALLKEWSGIHAPVFFDFGEKALWCLLPTHQNMWGYVVAFPCWEFIQLHNNTDQTTENFEDYLNKLNQFISLNQLLEKVRTTPQVKNSSQQRLRRPGSRQRL